MIDLNYITFNTKSIVARHTIIACSVPNNNKIRPTGKSTFAKIDIVRLSS
jgi:hypothetical protein